MRGAERSYVAHEDEPTPRSRDGHAEPAWIPEEAYVAEFVGARGREDDQVSLLTLERVDGADSALAPARLQLLANLLNLPRVGRNDGDVCGRDISSIDNRRDDPCREGGFVGVALATRCVADLKVGT
eukprot:CAMPEP_0115872142 /NCGR_PEP_ID=MMETSP0287-20121206/23264_1 /TAXON_ID=412157 /ORGANISM="Chrysochromulina rotalis, Strain UIO044" /LENGTH=126 /DNA_ID=CAMNT_0003327035 /DNA_START=183 /DNA_END=563 /DNA_ORIENTATION=-